MVYVQILLNEVDNFPRTFCADLMRVEKSGVTAMKLPSFPTIAAQMSLGH